MSFEEINNYLKRSIIIFYPFLFINMEYVIWLQLISFESEIK